QFLIPIENFVVAGGFETTVSGSFRGLGQFNRQTWDGLRRLGRNLPAFEEGSAQLNASLYAIGFLYLENKRAYEASFKGRVLTHEIAYLYHNQGAPDGYVERATLRYIWEHFQCTMQFSVKPLHASDPLYANLRCRKGL
ncbi:hypothetical protein, partial [Deinococcus alpinitundrae]|uniref:hypothetical protein n=1 Tax=Deinococcus alpinitundrae TaxID=468913 RepID=UPI00192A4B0D